MIRRVMYALADSKGFTGWFSRRGMKWGFARRFIAAETLEEAFPAIRALNGTGLDVTLDYLGEAVTDESATREAVEIYRRMLDTIDNSDVSASISLKLSQLGQKIGASLTEENLRVILTRAAELDNFVRIDIEDSTTTQRTAQDIGDLNEIDAHVLGEATRLGRGRDDFEFQMLYGIRRDAQTQLVQEGYNMRVYVPFGSQWCPYFMRRIAERPANALFIMRAMLGS